MSKFRWIASALIAVSAPASAESWFYVNDTQESIGYIDADSIETEGSSKSFTLFIGYGDEVPDTEPKGIYYIKGTARIDCASKSWAILTTEGFSAEREYLGTEEVNDENGPIEEGTIGDSYFRFVCTDDHQGFDAVDNPFDDSDDFFLFY